MAFQVPREAMMATDLPVAKGVSFHSWGFPVSSLSS